MWVILECVEAMTPAMKIYKKHFDFPKIAPDDRGYVVIKQLISVFSRY